MADTISLVAPGCNGDGGGSGKGGGGGGEPKTGGGVGGGGEADGGEADGGEDGGGGESTHVRLLPSRLRHDGASAGIGHANRLVLVAFGFHAISFVHTHNAGLRF